MDDTAHTQSPLAAAQRAIAAAGGGARLASQIGVTRFAVQQWLRAGIPAARLPAVERITGIPMRELRPDLWPAQPAEAA
jgi:DNA-binding transcriptional regulator YdaS (Cro superfamily)